MKKGDKVRCIGNGFGNLENETGEVMDTYLDKCYVLFDNYHHVGQYIIQNDSLLLLDGSACTFSQSQSKGF
jgi:hypothetical protein